MHATRIGGCVAIVLGEGATGPTRALGAVADGGEVLNTEPIFVCIDHSHIQKHRNPTSDIWHRHQITTTVINLADIVIVKHGKAKCTAGVSVSKYHFTYLRTHSQQGNKHVYKYATCVSH